jgi:hypothetical protein
MTQIRVDPTNLCQVAQQLEAIASRLRALGHEARHVTVNTPSYDGRFRPQARGLGLEAEARLSSQADRLLTLSEELKARAATFEAVDHENQVKLTQLMEMIRNHTEEANLILSPFAHMMSFPWQIINQHLRLANLIEDPGKSGTKDTDDDQPPWWTPVIVSIAQGWDRATTGAQSLINLGVYTLWRASNGADSLSKLALHVALRAPDASHVSTYDTGQPLTPPGPSSGPFMIGPPQRPNIQHDNGFLETFSPRQPTLSDYFNLLEWKTRLQAAEIFHPELSDATASYRHFLEGEGVDRYFSYDSYIENDTSGATTLTNAIHVAQVNTEDLCATTSTCSISSVAFFGGGDDARFPYPATENWQKTIGAHAFWLSADVDVEIVSSTKVYTMDLTLHAEDRYNFNPGMHDIATGIPDSENGRFEITGLGHQYMHYSTLLRTVSWEEGDYDTTTILNTLESDASER